ncbi:MAG: carbohydrate ABC transporter permease [Cellulosilyticaceae bacterium]
MVVKKSIGEKIFDGCNYLMMGIFMIVCIYPLLYVVFASFSNPQLLMKHTGLLFKPLGEATLQGYILTFNNPNILIGYRNTIFYVVIGTLINLVLTAMGAYVVTRSYFKLKTIMLVMITITMFFGGGLIPMFFVIKTLGLYDTVWAILLPGAISSWNLIIMKTFFQAIPRDLEESAIIDGASDWTIFSKIIIPLSKPVLAVMVLYYGVGHWNSWFNASVFLRDRKLFPLQLFLREILMMNQTMDGSAPITASNMLEESYYKELVQYCTIIISTLPILCIYPFLQKYFVKGVMIGAIKG